MVFDVLAARHPENLNYQAVGLQRPRGYNSISYSSSSFLKKKA